MDGRNPHFSTGADNAEDQLGRLELDAPVLTTALLRGVAQARNITSFHPTTARGFTQWSETVASLREQLDHRLWTRHDPQNSPRITSPTRKTTLLVAGGDPNTGVSQQLMPRTARRRGPATQRAVQCSGQQMLDIPLNISSGWDLEADLSWILLYHWSTSEPVIRGELSLPSRIEKGVVTGWAHRIILPEQDLTPSGISQRTDGPEDEVDFRIIEL